MTWIVFDYGKVLCLPWSDADASAMARTAGVNPVEFERRYWEHRLPFDRADLTPQAYWESVVGRPLQHRDVDRLVEMDVASWARPDQGTVTVLGELLAAGRRVALLSNAPVCMADGFDQLPWIAAIEHRFYSGRMQMMKPDAEIFESVARDLHAQPQHIVFVDDTLVNVQAAEQVGMTGIHFTGAVRLRELVRDLSLV